MAEELPRDEGDSGGEPPEEGGRAGKGRARARHYRPEDRSRMIEIVRAVYGDSYAATFDRIWDWEFVDNPFVPEGLPKVIVIEAQGSTVGFMGTLYAPLKLGSQVLTIAWLVGFMTHPEYRGAGGMRFVRLGRRMIQQVPLHLGNPGPHIVRFWSHFGALEMCRLPMRLRPLGLGFLFRGRVPGAFLGAIDAASRLALRLAYAALDVVAWLAARLAGVRVEEVERFGPEVDDLWQRARADWPNLVVRDRAFLEWRYERCPIGPYTILVARRRGRMTGYAVLRVFDAPRMRKGTIVDLFAPRGEGASVQLLVLGALRAFRRSGAHLAYALQSHPAIGRSLARLGFFNRSSDPAGGTRIFMGAVNPPFETDPGSFTRPENWFLSFGDLDQDLVQHLT